jgi:hypothetical protein
LNIEASNASTASTCASAPAPRIARRAALCFHYRALPIIPPPAPAGSFLFDALPPGNALPEFS